MSPELSIILTGSFVAASCALVGSFLVLRKMALLGDAISHAVLPGIVLAFLITHSRDAIPMVIGAGLLGVVTVFLVEVLNSTQRLKEDASIGVVFPALFSIGVILVSRYTAQVDLDLDCVLYGEIAYTPLDRLILHGRDIGPRALWITGVTFAAVAAFVLLFYKELKLTSFDPELAASLGFSPKLMHYLLMTAVSVTIVSAFESVGAILVVAMLVVPPAAAFLLTERLAVMLGLAVGIGLLSTVAGYALAHEIDCSIAGGMAVSAGAIFVLAFLFSRQGLVARLLRHRRISARLSRQLLLLHLSEGAESRTREQIRSRFGWTGPYLSGILKALEGDRLIEQAGGGFRLTPAGASELERIGTRPLAHV